MSALISTRTVRKAEAKRTKAWHEASGSGFKGNKEVRWPNGRLRIEFPPPDSFLEATKNNSDNTGLVFDCLAHLLLTRVPGGRRVRSIQMG